MDYAGVLKNTGRIIWRHKSLWLLGLLLMVGNLPSLVAGHYYVRGMLSFQFALMNSTSLDEFFDPMLAVGLNPVVLIGGTILAFLIFTVVWLISTIGEAALIRGVADYDDGRSPSFREMLSAGKGLLVRFIAIDTLIFLPLFLILLVQLLIVGGGLIVSLFFLLQPGADPYDLLPIGIIGGLIILFLSLLSVPVLLITTLFRLFAFRSAVLEDLPTRPSIRRAWELIRTKIVEIIAVFLLLYAVSYIVGMVTALLITPFAIGGFLIFLNPLAQGQFPSQATLDSFILVIGIASVISLFPNLFYRIFSSAVWTMTYREWHKS